MSDQTTNKRQVTRREVTPKGGSDSLIKDKGNLLANDLPQAEGEADVPERQSWTKKEQSATLPFRPNRS